MEEADLVENVENDPNTATEESGFTVSFVKADERARVSSSIASQVKRLLGHSDFELKNFQVYNDKDDSYTIIRDINHYDGGGIVAVKGYIPIESIKINSTPRSTRSYANIISPQQEVNIE